MAVIRNNTNLTKMTNKELKAITEFCLSKIDYANKNLWVLSCQSWLGNDRKNVIEAAIAYDSLIAVLGETERLTPSEESMQWSNLEGGHTINKTFELSIKHLLQGEIKKQSESYS